MRLGFHYHIPALEQEGRIRMPGHLGRFVDSLASHCRELVLFLHAPRAGEDARLDYALQAVNARLVPIGPHASVPARMLRQRQHCAPLRRAAAGLDALLLRGPSPLLPAMARAAGKVPTVLLLVGDYLAGVDSLPQPLWRKELIRLWSRVNAAGQARAARRSLVFVNSRLLYRQLEGQAAWLVETRTTTLSADDFYERADTCQQPPYHLLYTGRIDPAKGLLDMVEALALLAAQGEELVLDLVGWPEPGTTILADIERLAAARGLAGRVINHGYRPVGPELFAFYRRADLYLIASQTSEGFPRTIWEAMAHSLPVVATRVGSIPDFIEGAAELVEPRDVKGLAQALSYLINNSARRQKIIKQGIEIARENTLENRAVDMIDQIKDYLTRRN